MPIYAYKCSACGHAKDVLQKISDAPLSDCSECGQSTFSKQVTAAGFQLKGSGWYVTDFRGNGNSNGNSNGNGNAGQGAAPASSPASTESAAPAAAPAAAPTPAAPAAGSSAS